MSHSTAGETIHYQLIYPWELSVLENSITVTKPNMEFKKEKQEHGQLLFCTNS